MSIGVAARHTIASQRLRTLAAGLKAAAGGAVLEEANKKIRERMQRIANDKLAKHKRTGYAASIVVATPDARGIALPFPRYLRYQGERRKDRDARKAAEKAAKAANGGKAPQLTEGNAPPKPRTNWWIFARGVPFAIKEFAAKTYAEELRKLINP